MSEIREGIELLRKQGFEIETIRMPKETYEILIQQLNKQLKGAVLGEIITLYGIDVSWGWANEIEFQCRKSLQDILKGEDNNETNNNN